MESTSIQIPESNQVQSLRKGCDAWCLFGRPAHHTPCRTISRVKRLLCFFVGVTISHSLSRHNRFREHVRRKLKTMKLPCWRPSVCHLFTVCLMFFPQTACPHWGVLRVRIKIGFVQGWHLGPPFLLHTSSFLRCPCGFRLRGLARNVCRIWLLSEGLVLPAMCMFPGRRSVWWVWAMFWKSRKLVLWNHRCCCFGAWAHFFVPGAVLQKPWQKRGWSLDKLFLDLQSSCCGLGGILTCSCSPLVTLCGRITLAVAQCKFWCRSRSLLVALCRSGRSRGDAVLILADSEIPAKNLDGFSGKSFYDDLAKVS